VSRAEAVAETRSRLLEAAASEFAEKGYAGASLDAIAERAGRTKGAVYSNFESKAELFLALLDRHLASGFADIEARLASVHTAEELVAQMRDPAILVFKRDRQTFLLLWEFRLYALRNPEVGARLAERLRAGRAAIAHLIDRSLEQLGIAPSIASERVAGVLLCLLLGVEAVYHLDPDGHADSAFGDAIKIMLAGALRA
jgi:AcrR family transcriptional regulator